MGDVAFLTSIDFSSLDKTVDSIKRARARMLKTCGDAGYLILHRRMDLDHSGDRDCFCDPVIIAQLDPRPSVYFAEQILNPPLH